MNRQHVLGLLLVLGLSAACTPPAASTPLPSTDGSSTAEAASYTPAPLSPRVKVTVGLPGSTGDSGIFVAKDRGYFAQAGIDLDVQRFQTLVDMVAPLSIGHLQVAAGAPAAGLFNAANRGVGLRIVADKGATAGPEWDFSALVIRKDLIESGRVKDFADLKGLNLATTGRGTSTEVSLATALKKGNLTFNDVNYIQMALPDMVTAFETKGIDGAIVIEPFVSRLVSGGSGVRWKGTVDIFGANKEMAVIVYGEQFARNHDVAQRWMNAHIRGVRDYNDAFGPKKKGYEDVVRILTENTTVKDPKVYDQMRPTGLDPDGKLDLGSLQQDLNYFTGRSAASLRDDR